MASLLSTVRHAADVAVVLALGIVYVALLTVGTALSLVTRRIPIVRSASAYLGGHLRRFGRSTP